MSEEEGCGMMLSSGHDTAVILTLTAAGLSVQGGILSSGQGMAAALRHTAAGIIYTGSSLSKLTQVG